MASILIAASPKPREILERVLAGHALSFADTFVKAGELLRTQTYDLIVCPIGFDEARMLKSLRLTKSQAEWRGIQFICARVRPHVIPSARRRRR